MSECSRLSKFIVSFVMRYIYTVELSGMLSGVAYMKVGMERLRSFMQIVVR